MSDYRNEYVKKGDILDKSFQADGYFSNLISAFDVAVMQPADVVEVVRCKDCKMFLPNNNGFASNSPTGYCFHFEFDRLKVDFCSDGERKD